MMKLVCGSLLAFALWCGEAEAMNVSVVSDIHAGASGARITQNGQSVIVPNQYEWRLRKAMYGSNLLIAVGDNMNNDCGYAKELKRVTASIQTIWVKGNHDGGCFSVLSSKAQYVKNLNGWKFIVLDTSKERISDEQKSWLKKQLKGSKKTVVLSHVPLESVAKIVKNSGATYYFTGHEHIFNSSSQIPALSLQGQVLWKRIALW